MDTHNLSIYLNDHLAGSTAGLQVLEAIGRFDGLGDTAARLQREITQDQDTLTTLMRTLSIEPGVVRRAVGWVSEKLAEAKTVVDDHSSGPLRQLELLEVLAIGIDGKRALWQALQAAATREPSLAILDYPALVDRARQQRDEVERLRLGAATRAFGALHR